MSAVDPGTIQTLRGLPTSAISDAMDNLKLGRAVIRGVLPVSQTQRAFAGPAFTIRQAERHAAESESHLTQHGKVISEMAPVGSVVVFDVDGRTDVCTLGGLLALQGEMRGLAGFVVDGAVRDVDDIRELGFPVHCRAISPVRSTPDLQTIGVNETVSVGGAQVHPGDIIVADGTGVIAVPKAFAEAIALEASAIREREAELEAGIRAKRAFTE